MTTLRPGHADHPTLRHEQSRVPRMVYSDGPTRSRLNARALASGRGLDELAAGRRSTRRGDGDDHDHGRARRGHLAQHRVDGERDLGGCLARDALRRGGGHRVRTDGTLKADSASMAGVATADVGVVDESDDLVGEELAVVLRREVRLVRLRRVELQPLADALAQRVERRVGPRGARRT